MARVLRIVRPGDSGPVPDLGVVASEHAASTPRPDLQADAWPDDQLVARLRERDPAAMTALVARYGNHVRRVLFRIFGQDDSEHADVVQDVFMRAWRGIEGLEDPRALKAWLARIAVFTARGVIRGRRRRRWLSFVPEVPDPEPTWAGPDLRDAAHAVYSVLDRMAPDQRIPFALRALEGMDLESTAAACGVSLSTTRRRLAKAEKRFYLLAREYPALEPWVGAR